MRKLLFLMILLASFSCSKKIEVSGHRVEEARSVESYDRISVGSGFTVLLKQEKQTDITIKTFSSVFPYVKSYVSKGTLYVELEEFARFDEDPDIIITFPTEGIRSVDFGGGIEARSITGSIFDINRAEVHLSGGSSFRGEVVSHSFSASLSGGSKAELSGAVVSMSGVCSGGSSIDFRYKGTDFLNLDLSGGSVVSVMVNDKIESAKLSGGSKLYYEGTKIVEGVTLSGGSELIPRFN